MSTDRTTEIEEAASEWLICRDSSQWTESDQAQFEEWLNASTLHRVAFLRLELAWEESARLKALGAGIPADQPPPPGQWNLTPFFEGAEVGGSGVTGTVPAEDASDVIPADAAVQSSNDGASSVREGRAVSGTHRRYFGIAASILLAITATLGGYHYSTTTGERYTTPIGGLASVPMVDGSKITLNTNSLVRIALTETERRVDLKQGEAFFEVAKDTNRPFIVEAGNKRVIAVGTKFSVRLCPGPNGERDGESVEVVVTEGKVRIESDDSPHIPETLDPGTDGGAVSGTLLLPGAIARANDAGVLIERKSLPDAETHLSWRMGVLMFRDQTLGSAVAEFNRYNVRKIVIADPAVANLKVEGNFRATNVDAFVRLLESGFPVQATLEEDNIILTSR